MDRHDETGRNTVARVGHRFLTTAASRRVAARLLLGTALGGRAALRVRDAAAKLDDNWRLCRKCRGLWTTFNGPAVCPKGGGHDGKGSKKYKLQTGRFSVAVEEGGWSFCGKCSGLWWGNGSATGGVCPRGGAHDWYPLTNVTYNLQLNQPAGKREEGGWRYCGDCQGLFSAKGGQDGVCPAGGGHDAAESFAYVLRYAAEGKKGEKKGRDRGNGKGKGG